MQKSNMLMLLHEDHYVSSISSKKNATTDMVLHKAHYVSSLLTKNTLVHRAMQQH